MHHCLNVDEIVRLLACDLAASGAKATAVALACCSKSFETPVLDMLWETQDRLTPLLKCLPQEIWKEEGGIFVSHVIVLGALSAPDHLYRKSFQRIPTKAEWADFRKHTRRMKELKVDTSKDPVTLEILLALQFRTADEPFLPRLKTFNCQKPAEAFIPFIPFFLSPKMMNIGIAFAPDSRTVVIASTISRISRLCSDLECINLQGLARDPVVIEAVSEILLVSNRDSPRQFLVDSPLTEEAREVVYKLPKLSDLSAVILGRTVLPPVALPNLVSIDIEYDDSLDWLQGFRGATLEKLESVWVYSKCEQIGDFIGAFESAVVTASAHKTLSLFTFSTSRPWDPNYSSLLSFKQLETLQIEFSCDGGCSSKVDDDVITTLAQAMPKLKHLKLGRAPCRTTTGASVNGLIDLASRCPQLSELRIHFQVGSLIAATSSAAKVPPPDDEPAIQRKVCALRVLEVGETPVPVQSASTVALFLLQVFPRLRDIKYTHSGWRPAAETVKNFRQFDAFVRRTGKARGRM